jgi:dihydroorotate dehydrogenase electron transfer subunit
MQLQDTVKILWNEEQAPSYFKMGLAAPELARTVTPGQFVMVRVRDSIDPMLRRPFSIHNLLKDGGNVRGFEILYKVVGKGTKILSELRAGEYLSVLGPLGNGFTCPRDLQNVFLIAGGIGIAPLYYLASVLEFIARNTPFWCTLLLGGRTADDILCKEAFQMLGVDIKLSTENGSLGYKGLVTSLLEKELASGERPDIIYACGPKPMLKELYHIAAPHDIPCQFSLEAVMACGFGACMGCAVKGKENGHKYPHVCIDGPVFDPRLIEW